MYFSIMFLVYNFNVCRFLIFQKSRWRAFFWAQRVLIYSTEGSGTLACAIVWNKIRYCITTLMGCKLTIIHGPFTRGKRLHGGIMFITWPGQGSHAWPNGVINALPNWVTDLILSFSWKNQTPLGVSWLCFLVFRHLGFFLLNPIRATRYFFF